ncbi:MAG TPA: nucleotide sugar dehydrogenase [Gemmatimonadales bacterium]
MRVEIVGLGYVGVVTAASLARVGHEVYGYDFDHHKVANLRRGIAPIHEPGLPEAIAAGLAAGRLHFAVPEPEAPAPAEVTLIAVGTPIAASGRLDTRAVRRVVLDRAESYRDLGVRGLILIRSTLNPGDTDEIVSSVERAGCADAATVGFHPEFLREGTAIEDFFAPELIVLGGLNETALGGKITALYDGIPGAYHWLRATEAELLKLAGNAWHGVKITFANEIGRIGRAYGCDARRVMQVLTQDRKLNVSPAYMRPGFAYGGSCLPKDIGALGGAASRNAVTVPLVAALPTANDQHWRAAAEPFLGQCERIGLVGVSFKPGTDDVRESPALALGSFLRLRGLGVRYHDPLADLGRAGGAVAEYLSALLGSGGPFASADLRRLVEWSDGLLVTQALPDLPGALRQFEFAGLVVDVVGVPDLASGPWRYVGLCW